MACADANLDESAGFAQLSKRLRMELKDEPHMSTLLMVSAKQHTDEALNRRTALRFQKALVRLQVELYQTKK